MGGIWIATKKMVQKSCGHQLRLVLYAIIYEVLYIPGGCLGFLPSTVLPEMVCHCFPGSQIKSGKRRVTTAAN